MEPVVVWARKFRSVRYGAVERDGAGLGLAGTVKNAGWQPALRVRC